MCIGILARRRRAWWFSYYEQCSKIHSVELSDNPYLSQSQQGVDCTLLPFRKLWCSYTAK